MADFILTLGILAASIAGTLLVWRRAAGRPRSAFRFAGRAVVAFVLGLVIVLPATYYASKSRSFQLAGELVRRVETNEKVVALTFDDGPTPMYTEEVLGMLRAHEASATFYLVGAECEQSPESLRAIVEAGHELGNHTYSHRRLYFLSGSSVAEEVERTDAILRAAGYGGPITFRMPGCKRLLTTPLYLARNDRTTVIWDLEPDSIAGIAGDADAIVEYVVRGVRPGSIVLMHVMYESGRPSRDALPRILERLAEDGYRFVTVSELLALR